jgi:UDP-3-O-[3-hydroxymyristoyl] glucosamine N-acyltransferase
MRVTAEELARYLGAELEGDSTVILGGLAAPETAGPDDLIYCQTPRERPRAAASAARVVLVPPGMDLAGKTLLIVDDPKLAFARAGQILLAESPIAKGIHPTAVVAPQARLGPGVAVGPYAVIEAGAEIGAGCQIGAFCYLGAGVRLGRNCRLYPHVTLYPGVRLGDHVVVHAGAVLGSDGFGYVRGPEGYCKFPQIGRLEIEDEVEIGANTTLDRGSLGHTRVRRGCKLDNLVHVAHNVELGPRVVVAAQTGISGSSRIEADAVLAGQVGIADHCVVGQGAVVGAQAGVPTGKRIARRTTVWGTPARPLERFKQQYGWLTRLPELARRVARLERHLGMQSISTEHTSDL